MAAITVTLPRRPPKTFPPLAGFGAQFNTNLFTAAGEPEGLSAGRLQTLQDAVSDLKPGHSRIFVVRGLRPDTEAGRRAPQFVALMNTLRLAQVAGANVNLTFWGQGPYANARSLAGLAWPNKNVRNWPQPDRRKWPPELTDPNAPNALTGPKVMMQRFALTIQEARRNFDCVTHVTIQNEVNGAGTDIAKQNDAGLSMRMYELLYRHLDEALKALPDPNTPGRTLREAIRIIAGDLVESNEDAWLGYMHANMEVPRKDLESVLDGYSVHVYWEPDGSDQGFPKKLERRLQNVEQTLSALQSKKPVYVTEYGVRKLSANPRPGSFNGVKIEQSPEAAFQHAWFNALAPQHGFVGLTKWALYRTDAPSGWGEFGMIDAPARNFERSATYRVTRLFTHLVEPGWTAGGLARDATATVMASKFVGPNDQESVAVLNNSSQPEQVRVAGLKRQRRYLAVDWNRDGSGTINPLNPVTANASGAATINVPRHGVVALSTRALRL
jgi:hypothetical protein